ncbi:MAG: Crp/Fnr family transcriptional regulator [Bacteroidales bacterium]|nr:Crp/Fnr family transcriptional regulator [Bacteroidales bacterium]
MSMFETLMELPLFRGISYEGVAKTVETNKFHFLKFPAGEVIARKGDAYEHITFVINGAVRSTKDNEAHTFTISQTFEAPAVLAPDFLYGLRREWPATVMALTDCSILKISKADFTSMLYSDKVFMFNYLNMLSVNAQKALDGMLSLTKASLEERIAFWVTTLTQPQGKDIRLTCRARDLCSLFGVQRHHFDTTLSTMRDNGLLEFNNKELYNLNRRGLLELLHNSKEDSSEELPQNID